MIEQNNHRKFFSEEQSPIPVPPVEDAWATMKEKLNANLPVTGWQRFLKMVDQMAPRFSNMLISRTWTVAGLILGSSVIILLVWFNSSNKAKQASLPIVQKVEVTKELTSTRSKEKLKVRDSHSPKSNFNEKYSIPKIDHQQKNSTSDNFKKEPNLAPKGSELKDETNIAHSQSKKTRVDRITFASTSSQKNQANNSSYILKNQYLTKNQALQTDAGKKTQFAAMMQEWVQSNSSLAQSPANIYGSLIRKDKRTNSDITNKNIISKNGKGLASTPALKSSEKSKSKNESFAQRGMSNMSVGIEIKKTFPLGGQETSPYNINGKQNLLSDYIPAPYFKYFINYKFYVEVALHINSPQYVRSSKIVSQTDSLTIPTGLYTTKTTSVILNKLYYFDIPAVIHYKLFDHFYLGGGLQFSALSGGVGTEETRLNGYSGVPDSVTSNSIPLKNNSSAYNQLKKLDLRLLMDVNYQWRRFTIGLRYQQALATYLKTTQGSSGTSNKNSAIGVYLQYDIWRKK